MKPWPRTRKCVKWGGAAVTVLLVGAWVGSYWWTVLYARDAWGWLTAAGRGWLEVVWQSDRLEWATSMPQGFSCQKSDSTLVPAPWLPQLEKVDQSPWAFWKLSLPFWTLVTPTLAATRWAWRLDHLAWKRARPGLCPACGYARTGLNPGCPCPECGKPEPARA